MSYLELCNRVYSHIQSKNVREYYLNEVKDSLSPEQLAFIIKNGFYSLEEKFKDINELRTHINSSNKIKNLLIILKEMSDVESDFYNIDDDIIYSGGLYKVLIIFILVLKSNLVKIL